MATLRNKRKLAAVTRETQEKHPRNGQSRNTSNPRINEKHITQVSEEIESRVTKKLSQEFSRTESRILGALSKLDEFLLNQEIRTHSGIVPGTFRNTNVENHGTNEDDSQSDPHPQAGIFLSQITQNSGPEVARDNSWNLFNQSPKHRKLETPNKLLWIFLQTRRMQFWQHCRRLFPKVQKFLAPIQNSKKLFYKCRKVSARSPQTLLKCPKSSKKVSGWKSPSWYLESFLWKYQLDSQLFMAHSPNKSLKFHFFQKKISQNLPLKIGFGKSVFGYNCTYWVQREPPRTQGYPNFSWSIPKICFLINLTNRQRKNRTAATLVVLYV